jgi:hypothetical protein
MGASLPAYLHTVASHPVIPKWVSPWTGGRMGHWLADWVVVECEWYGSGYGLGCWTDEIGESWDRTVG